jgi:hypothetical protein
VTNSSFMANVGTLLLAACIAGGSLAGCSKKKEDETKAAPEKADADKKKQPQGDRYADGKRLESTLKDWTKRWSEQEELPACDPLLKDAAELELCKTAGVSLVSLKTAVAKGEPQNVLVKAAADLALATENASEKLRAASMAKMQAERKAMPAGSGVSAQRLPAGALSAAPKSRPAGSAAFSKLGGPKPGDKTKPDGKPEAAAPQDPAMLVMQAYSRVNRASLRYLSQFLQFGPLPTRKTAFVELEGLTKKKESWPALGRTLREAAMAENDPELQGKLKALAPKLSRRAPGAPGMTQGLPPGHPAPPSGAPAPAAAAAPAEK